MEAVASVYWPAKFGIQSTSVKQVSNGVLNRSLDAHRPLSPSAGS